MNPEETAREQGTPANFNFIERLRGRNYPTRVVEYYLDERVGLALRDIEELISKTIDKDKLAQYEAEAQELREAAKASKYEIHMEGISNERYDELLAESRDAYPVEHEEVVNPFTGVKTREEISSQDRNRMFTNLLWSNMIVKIVGPDGSVDADITPAHAESLRQHGPLDGTRRIAEAVEHLRGAVEWMDHLQNDDFFRKP